MPEKLCGKVDAAVRVDRGRASAAKLVLGHPLQAGYVHYVS